MLDATASVGHAGPAGRNFWTLGSKERSTGAAVVLGAARKRKEAGVRGSLFLKASVLGTPALLMGTQPYLERCSQRLSLEGHRIPGDITDEVVHRARSS